MSDPISSGSNSGASPRSEGPGTKIGRYKILQLIGEGGFGSVFEAEQEQPVRRRVALKIIKLGMDTKEVIARFEAERQALALMDHPNIARVLDGGATDSGRPYFVMELVRGEAISRYCDKAKLSVTDRLALFEQVCQAVQHAHTKGIIHRDLKPGNVLVSSVNDKAFAKVIDFGIAKAITGRITDGSMLTELNMMMGTPLYMSPEQAEGSPDIDTRTDIYSLGVLLYELLTGTTPFEAASMRAAAYGEMLRIIREVEPPRPSTRLQQSTTTITGLAAQRRMEPGKLTNTVRGELDWIVMKALEKDRGRRYDTASGLASDIRRYLLGQPVLAAPPSSWYQLKKFVRRHAVTVTAGSAVALALIVGMSGFAWQARIAQKRAAELEQVSNFQAAMLAQVDPTAAGELLSADYTARLEAALTEAGIPDDEKAAQMEAFIGLWQQVNATDAASALIDGTILKPAALAIDQQFKDQPVVDASLSQVLADVYLWMGMYDAALPLQERALALRRHELGEDHPETLLSINNLGEILHYQGKLEEAEPYYQEAIDKRRKAFGNEHPDTLASIANMGALLQAMGDLDGALPYYQEALDTRRRVLGADDASTLDSIGNMGRLLQDQGKLAEAEPFYREALEKKRRVLGVDHPETLMSINNMGALLRGLGKLDEAAPFYRDALDGSRRVLGEDHPETLTAIGNMGVLLRTQGKLEESEPFFREALDKRRATLGDEHPSTLISVINLGNLQQMMGKNAEAIETLVPVDGAVREAFTGDNAFRLGKHLMSMGKARMGMNEFAAAEALLLEAYVNYNQAPGPIAQDRIDTIQAISELYAALHAAEPDKGYGARAAQWKQKLDNPDSTDEPSLEPALPRAAGMPVSVTDNVVPQAVEAKAIPAEQKPQASAPAPAPSFAGRKGTVLTAGTGVNIRTGPNIAFRRIGMFTIPGTEFGVSGRSGPSELCDQGWLKVDPATIQSAPESSPATSSAAEAWACRGNSGANWLDGSPNE